MPAATCHPGQNYTFGFASAPVLLKPVTGQFSTNQGTVTLSSSLGGTDDMTVLLWTSSLIVALLPLANPGTGEDGETFTVSIDGGAFTAAPVIVAGPVGGYPMPPSHTPTNAAQAVKSQA